MTVMFKYITSLCVSLPFILPCFCDTLRLKVFASDRRTTEGLIATLPATSIGQCAVLFKQTQNALSFNFNKGEEKCELGENYPEDSNEDASGWTLVAKIIDGIWAEWESWGTCSNVGVRVRTRVCVGSSNGGKCEGSGTEEEECNLGDICLTATIPFVNARISQQYNSGWEACRAVDGNNDPSAASLATSRPSEPAWWRADFSTRASITEVTLTMHDKTVKAGFTVSASGLLLTKVSCSIIKENHIQACIYRPENAPYEAEDLVLRMDDDSEVLEIMEIQLEP